MGSGVMDRKLPGFKQWVAGSMGRRIDGDRVTLLKMRLKKSSDANEEQRKKCTFPISLSKL